MSDTTSQIPRHSVDAANPRRQQTFRDAEEQHDTRGSSPTTEMQPVGDDGTRIAYEPGTVVPYGLNQSSRRARIGALVNASAGVWIGLVLVAAGFVAIFYTWGKVAGVINVAQQMPYLVSGGISGLALVIVGVTAVDVAIRQQDSHERKHQMGQITRVLNELRILLRDEGELITSEGWED